MTTTTPPLLVSADEAAKIIGVSKSSFLRLDRRGLLGPRSVRLARLVRWNRREIETWIEAGCPARCDWLRRRGRP